MKNLFGEDDGSGFVDIRSTVESIAAEKAALCLELNTLVKIAPKFLATASVQKVRSWKEAQGVAMKVLASKTSSRQQLASQVGVMKQFLEV